MAKKSTTPKATEPDVTGSPVKPASKPKAAKKPATPKTEKPKAASRLRVKAVPVTKTGSAVIITEADIALRAYYIAEKRHKLGIPGDAASDWVEAERQLTAEAEKKTE